ncbi:MAG TPA: Dabb family protein, partial [Thermoanaerobaculia bacterium]|nr:Dabb family protein [Thermoanaerobaculia bacterium]
MVERVVMVRLRPDYRKSAALVARHTAEVLGAVAELRGIRVGVPADERTRRDWDVAILLRFDDLAAVERYRAGEIHRKYFDVYLRPMLETIRVWNFDA